MKITLSKDELNKAVALYVREKCVAGNGYGWEIPSIELVTADEDVTVIVQVEAVDPLKVAPSPCAPQAPFANQATRTF